MGGISIAILIFADGRVDNPIERAGDARHARRSGMDTNTDQLGARLAQIKGAKLIKSFCYTCPWQCPTEVLVRDGKVVYHKGNPESPNNIGSRCAKGMASSYLPRDPDRLRFPLLRTNPKGEPGQFKRISWDEAFDYIAGKLKSIRDKWGPEAVVYTCHHDPNTVFFRHLLGDLYGTPNNYTHTSGCEQDRRAACLTLFGHVFPMHDFVNSPLRDAVGDEQPRRQPGAAGEPRADRGGEEGRAAGRRRSQLHRDRAEGARVGADPSWHRRRDGARDVQRDHREGHTTVISPAATARASTASAITCSNHYTPQWAGHLRHQEAT
jgi:hypothetical protein